MSYWIPSPELNRDHMQKRHQKFEHIYFAVFSPESLNLADQTCFTKCVNNFASDKLSSQETSCLNVCRNALKLQQSKFLNQYSEINRYN